MLLLLLRWLALHVLLHAHRKLGRDAVVIQEAVERPEVHRPLVPQAGELHHHVRDAAEEGGEEDEGHQQHAHRHQALQHVRGVHVRAAVELREGPVHRGQVPVPQGGLHQAQLPHPAVLRGSEAVPHAGREVDDDRQAGDEPQDPQAQQEEVGVDPRLHVSHDLVHLHQSQQPQDPDEAHGLERPDGVRNARPAAVQEEEPLRDQDADVQGKPGPDVVPNNLPPLHHQAAITGVVAGVQGKDHVESPEQTCVPVHEGGHGALREVEGDDHGDHGDVVDHHEEREDVEEEPGLGLRVDDAAADVPEELPGHGAHTAQVAAGHLGRHVADLHAEEGPLLHVQGLLVHLPAGQQQELLLAVATIP
mmetsp:Transcript_7191/g.20222  ORF Transcript_7191/g.20222 Transcript_7191/m.20222 type:complete len:362 (-) Transcript_7191:1312-2397(-)